MIKYPNKKIVQNNSNFKAVTKRKSKGMSFEDQINKANNYYSQHDIAYIYKKPTPVKILKTRVNRQNFEKKVEIQKAVFEKKSTTDYNGLYKGFYIDFEAKETKYKTFNVKSNLHTHQKQHLINIKNHGGIAFLIISFIQYDKVFIVDIKDIVSQEGSLIAYEYFLNNAIEVKQDRTLFLNYLESLEELLKKEEHE